MQPQERANELKEVRAALRLLRIKIAAINDPALLDVDSLLSVAEAEVERVASLRAGSRKQVARAPGAEPSPSLRVHFPK